MPDFSKFKTPTNAAAKVHPKPKPKPRALIITYHHKKMKKASDLEKERYEREGCEVKTIFLYPPKPRSGKPERKKPRETLMDKITWLKESDTTVLVFNHHGEDPRDPEADETPDYLKGAAKGRMLAKKGLNEADLRQMRIRYGACYGAQKEANDFYDALHEHGAGNFVGDAKTELNGTIKENKTKISYQELQTQINDIKKKLEPLNILRESEITYEQVIQINELNKELEELYRKGDLRQKGDLKRGNSFVAILSIDRTNIVGTYRSSKETDPETGLYKYNPHYLAPVKTASSQVEKTWDPKRIEAFRNEYRRKIVSEPTRSTRPTRPQRTM